MNLTAQKIILYMAIFFLIFLGIVIAFLLQSSKQLQNFPPELPGCPDYWENVMDEKTGNNYCLNKKNLGKDSCSNKMDFNVHPYTGAQGDCHKKNWSKKCNLTWDGITNVENICTVDK